MKITNLRPLSSGGRDTTPAGDVSIRGTDAQDLAVAGKPDHRRQKTIGFAAGGLVVILVFGLLIRGWSSTEHTVSRERLRIATVTEGPFVRDVSAQGTVVAAVPRRMAVAGLRRRRGCRRHQLAGRPCLRHPLRALGDERAAGSYRTAGRGRRQ